MKPKALIRMLKATLNKNGRRKEALIMKNSLDDTPHARPRREVKK